MIQERNEAGKIKQQYDDSYMENLVEEYSLNRNAKAISLKENIPLQTLYYYIRKFGKQKPRRIHELNESYFKSINTQNKAYILGFIMADGCVSKTSSSNNRPNRLSINISYKDRIVLEFIKKELQCSYDIVDYMPNEKTFGVEMMSCLTLNSIKLCDDLAKYGVVENKTGYEVLPKLPNNLYKHFLRGFLDGDGYVTKNNSVITIGFCSNENMLLQIKQKLNKELVLESTARIVADTKTNKLSYIEYHVRNDIIKLSNYLYKTANFYLERKRIKLP